MTDSTTRSTRGPRRGYYWQDWYAAWIMLRCWAEPSQGITAIEVEAAGTPHVDDIVVHRRDRVAFKQLKHKARTESRFTGADMFSDQGEAPLIKKLFDGWAAVRTRNALATEVHLTSNAMPSQSNRNRPISPEEFQRQILWPARSGIWDCPDRLQPILENIRELIGTPDKATLLEFLSALRLEFGEPDEQALRQRVVELLSDHLRPDTTVQIEADAWVARVYDLSTRRSETGPLSRSDIDRELRSLFNVPHRLVEHRLSLPEHHVPRPELISDILKAAQETATGYLLVLGPPGCGKTTLATWLANHHNDRLLMRYHVFDPQRSSGLERQGRASALEFVRTMFDVLHERFPGETAPYVPVEETLPNAMATLREALERLAGNQLRLLVVDGIDHVVRSRVERHSLFDALPQPCPRNVVFVLFGQPDWEYPPWLGRAPRVPIPPFTKSETRSHVCHRMGWGSGTSSAAVADYLHDKSMGNPLSLFYNLSVVETLGKTPEEVSASLDSVILFGGLPHQEYDRLLDDLEALLPAPHGSKSLRRELLAHLAVSTVAVTRERLCAAFSEDGLTPRQASDYLIGLGPIVIQRGLGRFWLFHDDFRRYAEERTSPSERLAAHRRLAHALGQDWQHEELGSWAEHLWLGGEDRTLADLPGIRSIEHWFRAAPPKVVVSMHRLALASSFRLGAESQILRNALAMARAVEAANLPSVEADEMPPASGLKGWSFVIPPCGIDPQSLRRRASALEAAAYWCARETSLAKEIASRFMLSNELHSGLGEQNSHEVSLYLGALAKWLLRSGDLVGLRKLATDERFADLAVPVFREEILLANDEGSLAAWSEGLAGVSASLDRDLAAASLFHLVEGRTQCSLAISKALVWSHSINLEAQRDAAVLVSLAEGINVTEPRHLEALVRLTDRRTEPGEWREFFFHGFVVAASGPVRDLGLYEFPQRFTDGLSRSLSGHDECHLASFLWRCGCAAGLACRGLDLLAPQELEHLLGTLIGKETFELQPIQHYTFLGFARVYLPVIALAVRQRQPLAETAQKLVVPLARELLTTTSSRAYGAFEATWLITPDTWRAIAVEAHCATQLPGTEPFERVEWFRYWAEKGAERGAEPPGDFLATASIAALGVPRKTDPSDLAVDLLCANEDKNLDAVQGIRRLVDLLIRLDAEPEGHRTASYQLTRVLALAFRLSPSLLHEEFIRSTVEYAVSEPFGDTPSSIAIQWLKNEEVVAKADLLALWYWIASCPGSFGSSFDGARPARTALQMIIQRMNSLDAKEEVDELERWNGVFRDSPQRLTTETSFSSEHDGTEVETLVTHHLPRISEVRSRWFSSWWSSTEYEVLQDFLREGGDGAWEYVCDRIAEQVGKNSNFDPYDAVLVAQGLPELRPGLSSPEAFEIAIQHLAAKVRFQKEPSPRGAKGTFRSRVEVLVNLVARGIDVSDVETLLRSLRSLAALARNSDAAPAVEQEMLIRVGSDDPRSVLHALLVLRHITALRCKTLEHLRLFADHPDAWCRWLVCSILKIEPAWSELRTLTVTPGLISSDLWPAHLRPGETYYKDVSSTREIYLKRFWGIVDVEEEELRAWLETEFRNLPPLQKRLSGWHSRRRGFELTDNRMAEAAGNLACRLASIVNPSKLSALMASVARQDPWLALAEPVNTLPEGWIEVCRCEIRTTQDREEYLLRSLGLVQEISWATLDARQMDGVAELAVRLLFPEAPERFAWVAEEWSSITPPRMNRGPILPLSFFNSPFLELQRTCFTLVPRWDLLPFRNLRFKVSDFPGWIHPLMGRVLVGTFGEQLEDCGRDPKVSWWTGWYASPSWLETLSQSETSLIRFWRMEWCERHSRSTEDKSKVDYGLQPDVIKLT